MALLDRLFEASYKGAPFLVESASTSFGQKTVVHEFVNSDVQNIEELGKRSRGYTLGAVIVGDANGTGYEAARDRLLFAIEEGGAGILVHPFFGILPNIKVLQTGTLTEDLTILGEARFNIVFSPSETDGLPTLLSNIISLIGQLVDAVTGSTSSDIGESFNVTNDFQGNFNAANDKVENIIVAMETNSRALATIPAEIDSFNSLLNNLETNIVTAIQNPDELASQLEGLFVAFPTLFDAPSDQFNTLSLFFDFGDDDIPFSVTTVALAERKQNNDMLNGAVKTYSLAQAYVSAAQIEFTTADEINLVENRLEGAYQDVRTLAELGTESISSETIIDLQELRTKTQQFFDSEKITAKRIIPIQVNNALPSSILSFQLYNDSSLGANIAALNNDINVSNLSGEVQVFTE